MLPWERNLFGRPCCDPGIVAICCFTKIFLSRRYDGIEAYLKLHIIIDVETGIIIHFTITEGKGSDSKEFKRLIKGFPRIGKAAGDKAYSSRANCQAVADKKGTPFLCFKANATGKAKGHPAWQISFEAYTDNPDEWMNEYHIRSIIEAVFSSIKRCLPPPKIMRMMLPQSILTLGMKPVVVEDEKLVGLLSVGDMLAAIRPRKQYRFPMV